MALAALLAIAGGAVPAAAAGPADSSGAWSATRTLVRRLKAAGRAEAKIERSVFDPMVGKRVTVRGQLALEPPDRARLRFPATGEEVTLRGDGGEWLQPQLQQMLRLGPEQAETARRWWDVLLPERDRRVAARSLGDRRYLLVARAAREMPADSAWIELDAAGLPRELEIDENGDRRTRYQFSHWRFSAARGRSAFVLHAPRGFEVMPLP